MSLFCEKIIQTVCVNWINWFIEKIQFRWMIQSQNLISWIRMNTFWKAWADVKIFNVNCVLFLSQMYPIVSEDLSINCGPWFCGAIFLAFCSRQDIFRKSHCVFYRRIKVIRVLNDMVSKWWQNFHDWVNYSFNWCFQWHSVYSGASPCLVFPLHLLSRSLILSLSLSLVKMNKRFESRCCLFISLFRETLLKKLGCLKKEKEIEEQSADWLMLEMAKPWRCDRNNTSGTSLAKHHER